MYVKYDLDVTPKLYVEYEEVRKKWQHEHLTKEDIKELLQDINIPAESPSIWKLLLKYNLIKQEGKARYTYYIFPHEQPSQQRLLDMEKEYYNGMSQKPKKNKPQQAKELSRFPITEDYCIEFLKKTGKYLIFELRPDVEALKKILNPHLLLDYSKDVKLR